MSAEPAPNALVVRSVTKTFRVPREAVLTLKERAMHPFRRVRSDEFVALRDVSFEVPSGEFFGIVGRNGSGKSTLLKCLAGIYGIDDGEMYVRGRMSTFIELGVGFNPDLAARDNIIMNAIMLGLSPGQARDLIEPVLEFAELEEFSELKLKNYSSGMHVRLAFSVMIQVDADILLIDEVLAVGDASFQQKCFDVFNDMRDAGKTILFVTHDMGAVERFCHRAMLLERGKIVSTGESRKVAADYLELNFGREAAKPVDLSQFPDQQPRGGNGDARIVDAWIEDADGQRKNALLQGDRCVFKARVRFERDLEDPSFGVTFVNDHKQNQFVVTTNVENERTGTFRAGEEIIWSVAFDNHLGPGRYFLSMTMAQRGAGSALVDRWERAFNVVVMATRAHGGQVDLPHEIAFERVAASDVARSEVGT